MVLVEVPSGWGATTVLQEFGAILADPDEPVAISISTNEVLRAGRAADAKALSDALLVPLDRSRLAHLFGLDTPAGKTGLALGVSGLFVSGMAVQNLHATPATADEDRLRLHHALAGDYGHLGGYTHALQHATEELAYRRRLQHPDHPDVPGPARVVMPRRPGGARRSWFWMRRSGPS